MQAAHKLENSTVMKVYFFKVGLLFGMFKLEFKPPKESLVESCQQIKPILALL